jgi:hypothetical protein
LRNDAMRPTVLYPVLFDKPLTVTFDKARADFDGSAILLKAGDRALRLTESFRALGRGTAHFGVAWATRRPKMSTGLSEAARS